MSEPCKLFSVQMPYGMFKKVKGVAKERELSVNRVIRIAVEELLKKEGLLLEK